MGLSKDFTHSHQNLIKHFQPSTVTRSTLVKILTWPLPACVFPHVPGTNPYHSGFYSSFKRALCEPCRMVCRQPLYIWNWNTQRKEISHIDIINHKTTPENNLEDLFLLKINSSNDSQPSQAIRSTMSTFIICPSPKRETGTATFRQCRWYEIQSTISLRTVSTTKQL